jgi:hypothetical protein
MITRAVRGLEDRDAGVLLAERGTGEHEDPVGRGGCRK